MTDLGHPPGSSSYNSSNELTTSPTTSFTYDTNGNTTSRIDSVGTTTYSWDFDDRLTSVVLPNSGATMTFLYDPFGRRVEKISPYETDVFVYDGANFVETVDGTGNEIAAYVQDQGIDEPLASERNGNIDYYEQDGLGSVTSLTAMDGSIAQTYTYDSFGNITNSTGSLTNTFGFTGREFDTETNLYYYRARYYSPQTGRFISEDPTGFDGGVNMYAYTENDPVNRSDPSGLWAQQQNSTPSTSASQQGYFEYQQTTGQMTHVLPDGSRIPVGTGYSGQGNGLNNPSEQYTPNTGPIPQGNYGIDPQADNTTGAGHRLPGSMRLDPRSNTHGRAGFLIHGDNLRGDHSASNGCVILPRPARNVIGKSKDHTLVVIP